MELIFDDDDLNTLTTELKAGATGVKSGFDFPSGWYSVEVNEWATVPCAIATIEDDSKHTAPIYAGEARPIYVEGGSLWVRVPYQCTTSLAVFYHGPHRPAEVTRERVGSTAKSANDDFTCTHGGGKVTIDDPSTGQHASYIAASHANAGIIRISTNDKKGIELGPGEKIFLPRTNGKVKAEYFQAASETTGDVAILKIECAWIWEAPA